MFSVTVSCKFLTIKSSQVHWYGLSPRIGAWEFNAGLSKDPLDFLNLLVFFSLVIIMQCFYLMSYVSPGIMVHTRIHASQILQKFHKPPKGVCFSYNLTTANILTTVYEGIPQNLFLNLIAFVVSFDIILSNVQSFLKL